MPRELRLVSAEPATGAHVLLAAVEVDGSLVPRLLYDGWVTQLVDHDDVAVVSIEQSREIEDTTDLERLTGLRVPTGPCWLTEATAPWGPAGEVGIEVVRALARLLEAQLSVEAVT